MASTFASRYLSDIEEGKGLGASAKEIFKDTKKDIGKKFSKENLVKSVFGGDDIFSAMIRGRLGITKYRKEKSPTKEGVDSNFIETIARNSLALPGIAKDMNILRQNIVELARIERKAEEQQDLSKQGDFFKSQDTLESQLEAQKLKSQTPGSPTAVKAGGEESPPDGKPKTGGMFGGIVDSIKEGLLGGISGAFSPKMLIGTIGKTLAIGAILASLWKGITAGFEKWKETGSLSEAFITGFGKMLDFVNFGLFGEDSLRKLIKDVGDAVEPIIDNIKETYYSMKDWIANNVGIPRVSFTIPYINKDVSFGPYYPFKKDSKSSAKENSAGEFKAQRTAEKVQKEMQKATDFITGVDKQLGPTKDKVVEEVNKNMEKATSLVKDLPKDRKEQANILGNLNAITESNLQNIKKLNAKGDYSLGRAEDYEKNVVNPVKNQLATAQNKFNQGPEGGWDKLLSGSMDKATQALSGKISAGGAAENTTGSGSSLLGGGSTAPTPTQSAPSLGSDIASKSSQISEGQRMESAADIGSLFNAPVTNNTSGSMGSGNKPQVGDTYNMDLLNLLART